MPQRSLKAEMILQRCPTLVNIPYNNQSLDIAAARDRCIDLLKAASFR